MGETARDGPRHRSPPLPRYGQIVASHLFAFRFDCFSGTASYRGSLPPELLALFFELELICEDIVRIAGYILLVNLGNKDEKVL